MTKTRTLALSAAFAVLALVPSASDAQSPTWTADIAPLMQDKCMNCHRPGEVAPMSLRSSRTRTCARGRARSRG